jgi:DNA polymerase III alpha subunit
MPGSAKGVMFITLEDETANANLIVWPSVFDQNRRTILAASMMGCRGKVQRASDVIHLVVEQVRDLSSDLKMVSGLDVAFPLMPMRRSMGAVDLTVAIRVRVPSPNRATCTSRTCTSIR